MIKVWTPGEDDDHPISVDTLSHETAVGSYLDETIGLLEAAAACGLGVVAVEDSDGVTKYEPKVTMAFNVSLKTAL